MIFPSLKGKAYGYANVAAYGQEWLRGKGLPGNPLLDPAVCQRMVADLHRRLDVDWSYGGWFEDRSALWRGSYITERSTPLHLGVDFNVPEGTPVAADVLLRCLRVDDDHPEPHGWGMRFVARVVGEPFALVFAHLRGVRCEAGAEIVPGDIVAEVGAPERNGGWYPHVHVQAMRILGDKDCLARLAHMDGYGANANTRGLARRYPDPLQFVALR